MEEQIIINQQNMHVVVINRRSQEAAKQEIERQLFSYFSKLPAVNHFREQAKQNL